MSYDRRATGEFDRWNVFPPTLLAGSQLVVVYVREKRPRTVKT
jgi:hypothetical protein